MDSFHSIYFTSEPKSGALSEIMHSDSVLDDLKASGHRQEMEAKSPLSLPPRTEAESLVSG